MANAGKREIVKEEASSYWKKTLYFRFMLSLVTDSRDIDYFAQGGIIGAIERRKDE